MLIILMSFTQPIMLPSYRNQSIDLHSKSIDWLLYEGNTGTLWVNHPVILHIFGTWEMTLTIWTFKLWVMEHEEMKEYKNNVFSTSQI